GMLNRAVRSSIPPHVDYSLTDLGLEIAQPLAALTSLVESRLDEVVKAQELYDAQQGKNKEGYFPTQWEVAFFHSLLKVLTLSVGTYRSVRPGAEFCIQFIYGLALFSNAHCCGAALGRA